MAEETEDKLLLLKPDRLVTVREAFGVDSDMKVPAFSQIDTHVPELDPAYKFDPTTTLAICGRNRAITSSGVLVRPSWTVFSAAFSTTWLGACGVTNMFIVTTSGSLRTMAATSSALRPVAVKEASWGAVI